MRKGLLRGFLVLALLLAMVLPATPALAADPEVAITVTAQVVSMTNTQTSFPVGVVEAGDGATKWGSSDTYSTAENTGNVDIDIELQGTDLEGGVYDWTLGTTAGDKIYSLYANSDHSTTYNIEIKSSAYTDLTTSLAATWTWSMQFTPPTIFDAADDGTEKSSTLTLVASASA